MLGHVDLIICLMLSLLVSLTLLSCAVLIEARGNTSTHTLLLLIKTVLILRNYLTIFNHIWLRSVLQLMHLVMLLKELKL